MSTDILTSTFLRLQSRLRATARRFLADDSDADDALQETFCRLWQRRDTIESSSQAEGLSVIAVRNACIDTLRRRKQTAESEDLSVTEDVYESPDEGSEIYESINAIMDRHLNERERAVITMHDIRGYAYDEIAEELGITEANARAIVSRTRKTLRQIYLSSLKN